ncbi:TPA: terminase small subunit [Burkholderia vietnamiensis]|nr:terminase small subunit [Burkholderia vietnamiensis]HEP6286377.1 terminase small subunit [Burkholderia vietnamiensis]HEP6310550.1 terminase small subunit [Burkholderia vietnamiensis]
MSKLTAKQQRFVDEYLVDLNASAAARRAGYSEKTAGQIGERLLKKVEVQHALAASMKARAARTEINADHVLKRMAEIDAMDLLDIMNDDMSLKPVSEWPKVWRQYLSGFYLAEMFEGNGDAREMVGILKKIKWPDKLKNLEMLGRHFGMFNDKLELSKGPKVRVKDLTGRKQN